MQASLEHKSPPQLCPVGIVIGQVVCANHILRDPPPDLIVIGGGAEGAEKVKGLPREVVNQAPNVLCSEAIILQEEGESGGCSGGGS